MTFTQYLEQKRFTAATVNSYASYIQTFTDWLLRTAGPGEFTYNELLDFIRYLQGLGKSRKAIQHLLGIVRHYCNYLTVESQRSDNPAAGVFIKGIIRKLPANMLSWEEMEELYRHIAYS